MNKQTNKNPLSFVGKEGNQESSFQILILNKSSLKDAELKNSNRLREPQRRISQHKKINQELSCIIPNTTKPDHGPKGTKVMAMCD